MLLALNSIISPKNWEHDPELTDENNNTVAKLLIYNRIIPTK